MESCVLQHVGFCLDKCGEEQMAKGVEIRGMMKKKDVESRLSRASKGEKAGEEGESQE